MFVENIQRNNPGRRRILPKATETLSSSAQPYRQNTISSAQTNNLTRHQIVSASRKNHNSPDCGRQHSVIDSPPSIEDYEECEVDVREHLSLDTKGNILISGPTNTLYASPITPNLNRETRERHSNQASALITAEAGRQRQLENLYRASAKGSIYGVKVDLAFHLLDLHWNRNHFFLLTYRPAVMRDLINGGGPYFSELLFYTMLATAARYSERLDVRTDVADPMSAGVMFYKRVRELLFEAIDTSTIPTAAALLLLGNAQIAMGEVDRGWLYTGMGIRMIINLGLHLDVEQTAHLQKRSAEDVEVCKRVFWGAFISEKLQSLYVGRPAAIHEEDMHVSKEFMDTYEEWDLWSPVSAVPVFPPVMAQPAHSVSSFKNMCTLGEITGRIISKLYCVQSTRMPSLELLRIKSHIHAALNAWFRDLPPCLQYTPWSPGTGEEARPTHIMILHTLYYSLIILLGRPFVSNGHLRKAGASVTSESWRDCSVAASKIAHLVRIYKQAFGLSSTPYQISYAAYVASTIHVRNAASPIGSKQARNFLTICVHALREMKPYSKGVSTLEGTIRRVMGNMNVNIDDQQPDINDMFVNPNVDLNAIMQSFDTSQLAQTRPRQVVSYPTDNIASQQFLNSSSAPQKEGNYGPIDYSKLTMDPQMFWISNDSLFGCLDGLENGSDVMGGL